jgi:hypothetical protein
MAKRRRTDNINTMAKRRRTKGQTLNGWQNTTQKTTDFSTFTPQKTGD